MISIQYSDIAPGAREAFAADGAGHQAPYSVPGNIRLNDMVYDSFANPCEGYDVPLDGGDKPPPYFNP